MTKDEIREAVRARRAALDPAWAAAASARVAERALALPGVPGARAVALYMAMAGEVATGALADALRARGARLYLPAWRAGERRYAFARWADEGAMSGGPLGIPQPAAAEWVGASALDVALVPGLGFDAAGGRVGHGRGHYDRLLAGAGQRPLKVALAFEFQIFERVPVETGDVRMDVVVTEQRVIEAAGRPAAAGR